MSLTPPAGGLILFHGAGGNRDHRVFVAMEERLPIPVRRVNFPYRELGARRPPPRVHTLLPFIDETLDAAASDWGVDPGRIVLGGRSMGGRVASMAAADGVVDPAGLLLLSYPLHPPGKPEKLRVEHLPALSCPAVVMQGDADPFGRPAEIESFAADFGGGVEVIAVGPGGHDPKDTDRLVDATATWLGITPD